MIFCTLFACLVKRIGPPYNIRKSACETSYWRMKIRFSQRKQLFLRDIFPHAFEDETEAAGSGPNQWLYIVQPDENLTKEFIHGLKAAASLLWSFLTRTFEVNVQEFHSPLITFQTLELAEDWGECRRFPFSACTNRVCKVCTSRATAHLVSSAPSQSGGLEKT